MMNLNAVAKSDLPEAGTEAYHYALDAVIDGVFIVDNTGTIEYANASAVTLLGNSLAIAQGQLLLHTLPISGATERAQLTHTLDQCIKQGKRYQLEHPVTLTTPSAQRYLLQINTVPLITNGKTTGAIIVCHDITEQQQLLAALSHHTTHDQLTQLPNRHLFLDRLQHALNQAQRQNRKFALLLLNLNRFKAINDSLGHDAGDLLLQAVARRLLICVHGADTVARLGSDEFVVLLEDVVDRTDITTMARKIRAALSQVFTVQEQEFYIDTCIGISHYPEHGTDGPLLLKNAAIALQQAKSRDSNSVRFYQPAMHTQFTNQLARETDLRRALERDELVLYYQPQIDLVNGSLIGVEALMRWQHPAHGLASAAMVIPLAEETGLIHAIGDWAITTACHQAKAWYAQGLPAFHVAVNLSARQFLQPEISHRIAKILSATNLEPQWLKLEITESMLMHDATRAEQSLAALKAMGIKLAIDDFGTGYSSLSYLKRFPLDWLKIDRTFVQDITTDPDDAAIAATIIAMAHSLQLQVIAEGVETDAQLAFLEAHHCDAVQGYYVSRPLPAAAIPDLVQTYAPIRSALPQSQKTVLIVDDDPNISELIATMLEQDDYRVVIADNATAGLELLARQNIQVVLSDYQMPEMNGTTFLRRVRLMYPNTIRILMSAHQDFQGLAEAVNDGAIFRFVEKPVHPSSLLKALREAFRQWLPIATNTEH